MHKICRHISFLGFLLHVACQRRLICKINIGKDMFVSAKVSPYVMKVSSFHEFVNLFRSLLFLL